MATLNATDKLQKSNKIHNNYNYDFLFYTTSITQSSFKIKKISKLVTIKYAHILRHKVSTFCLPYFQKGVLRHNINTFSQ
jgi:hypothetical protein